MSPGSWANRARALGGEPWLVLAVLSGAWLRLHEITRQIVADDEWHALHAAREMDCGWILTHFGISDHCIPLALYDHALMLSVGLTELGMRLPVLVAGIGSLILLPLWLRPLLGRAASTAFAWLLAVSPLHIYFSRFVRPYDIALLLSFGGAVAAFRWWSGAGRRWALLYVACAALAPWFHLSALMLSVAPLLAFAAAALLTRTLDRRRAARLLAVGGALAAALALLLGPPLLVDLPALTAKTGTHELPDALAWIESARLWSGTGDDGALLTILVVALVGMLVLARAQARFVAFLLALVGLQLALLLAARPVLIQYSSIFARYLLIALPVELVFVAAALGALESALRRRLAALPAGLLAPIAAAGLFWVGPLGFVYDGPNNWTNHPAYQYWYPVGQAWSFKKAALEADPSGFYTRLGLFAPPGSLTVVEAPWLSAWSENYALALTQRLHHQWVTIGFVGDEDVRTQFSDFATDDGRIRFRNVVHVGDAEELKRRGVRLVIFHRDLLLPPDQPTGEVFPDAGPWIERYRERYGAPIFEDEHMSVFDLGG